MYRSIVLVFAALGVSISFPGLCSGETFIVDDLVGDTPVLVTGESPVAFTVDFGTAFSDVERVVYTGTFVDDLLDDGEWFGVCAAGECTSIWNYPNGNGPLDSMSVSLFMGSDLPAFRDGVEDIRITTSPSSASVLLSTLEARLIGTAVPEPCALVLGAVGLVCMTARYRKR